MSTIDYLILTIIGCTLATWLTRMVPIVLMKHYSLPALMLEFLSFVPIVIMTVLWVSNLFEQRLGHLPVLNLSYLLASLPTIIGAFITKNLLAIVLIGIISLALLRALGV